MMQYTQQDVDMCTSSNLVLTITLKDGGPKNILFQFPLRVSSDNRSGDWDEKSTGPNTGDKIGIYKSANPRHISLDWYYMVDGGKWPASKIHDQLRVLRGYYRNPFISDVAAGESGDGQMSPMVILLKVYDVGGDDVMSFRADSVGIKHSGPLIGPPKNPFPLRTDVSLSLKSWPQLGTNPPVQLVKGQREFKLDWF